jgi:hypothetical protein
MFARGVAVWGRRKALFKPQIGLQRPFQIDP